LSSLTGLEKKRTLDDVDRAAVGLDEPEIEVTLLTADGGELKLEVGPEVPASSDRIVAAGEVYQVAGSFVASLTKQPGEWRDKELFTATRGDVDRVTLAAGDSKVLLARRGDDFWIESPLTDRADGRLTDDLLTDVTGLRVATFLDEAPLDPEVIGLEPPRRVVEVVLKDEEEPFRLELGAPVGVEDAEDESAGDVRTYGRAEGQLFEIESSLGEAFGRPPQAWRSRQWTALEVFKIESASIHGGDGDLELTRDKADWKRGEDRIDYSTASDLLYALTDAAAEEVVDRADAESRGHRLDEPSLSIRLTTKEGEDELRLYPEVDGFAAATAEGREAVLLLPTETVSGIHEKIDAVRTAAPLVDEEDEEDDGVTGEASRK
jgi:hypothetical protein